MYHSRIVLSVGGSAWYMIRNLRCTVTIDSVLANSTTQNDFLFTVNAIFRHDYPLAVEPGSTPRPLVQKKLGEILYLFICSFLPCLSWLLRSQVRKSQRDLRITLYLSHWPKASTLHTFWITIYSSIQSEQSTKVQHKQFLQNVNLHSPVMSVVWYQHCVNWPSPSAPPKLLIYATSHQTAVKMSSLYANCPCNGWFNLGIILWSHKLKVG